MRLHFERILPVPPSAAWPFLTDPELMNRWSDAAIRRIAVGDGDEPWAVGTLRSVTIRLPRGAARIEEVVETSRPPHHFVYRVVNGAPIRSHRGEMRLSPVEGGTRFTWDVEAEFPVPLLGATAGVLLRRQVGASIDRLVDCLQDAAEAGLRPDRDVDDSADLASLYAGAEAIRDEQRVLADRLAARNDPKQWFARVYQFVTEELIDCCRQGRFTHPGWVLRLIPRFHHYYRVNLDRYCGEAPGYCEHHWISSFRAADNVRGRLKDPLKGIGFSIAKGMQAHIEEDLPRTLAEIYVWHYAYRSRYGRFRSDYMLMRDVFGRAADRLKPLFPKAAQTLGFRVFETWTPEQIKDEMMRRFYYDIPRQRRRAFERGERLANLMLGTGQAEAGRPQDTVIRRPA